MLTLKIICSLSKLIHTVFCLDTGIYLAFLFPQSNIYQQTKSMLFMCPFLVWWTYTCKALGRCGSPIQPSTKFITTPTSWRRNVIIIARRYPPSNAARLSGYLASIRHPSARGASIDHAHEIVQGTRLRKSDYSTKSCSELVFNSNVWL